MEAPQQRKGRSVDALKKAGEHPAVIVAVARLFWAERARRYAAQEEDPIKGIILQWSMQH